MSEQNVKAENVQSANKSGAGRENQGSGAQRNSNQGYRNGGGRHSHGGYRGNHRSRGYYDRERNGNGNDGSKSGKESIAQREGGKNIADVPVKRSPQSVNNSNSHVNTEASENHSQRPAKPQKNFQRDNNRGRSQNIKVDETREDIIRDIGRIEKEIELEIKEISALQFGM